MADREFVEASAHLLGLRVHIEDGTLYVSGFYSGSKIHRWGLPPGGLASLTDDEVLAILTNIKTSPQHTTWELYDA